MNPAPIPEISRPTPFELYLQRIEGARSDLELDAVQKMLKAAIEVGDLLTPEEIKQLVAEGRAKRELLAERAALAQKIAAQPDVGDLEEGEEPFTYADPKLAGEFLLALGAAKNRLAIGEIVREIDQAYRAGRLSAAQSNTLFKAELARRRKLTLDHFYGEMPSDDAQELIDQVNKLQSFENYNTLILVALSREWTSLDCIHIDDAFEQRWFVLDRERRKQDRKLGGRTR